MSGETNNSFFVQLNTGFFTQFGKQLSSLLIQKNANIPFKDNAHFPLLVDILGRKDSHHARLCLDLMPKFHIYFLEAFMQHLSNEHIPLKLRATELIYIQHYTHNLWKTKAKSIEKDFELMLDALNKTEKYLLFALPEQLLFPQQTDDTEDSFLRNQFESLLSHPKARILLLCTNTALMQSQDRFNSVIINGLNDTEVMAILKLQRNELEQFHQVIIPEELLSQAYKLSERFLSTNHTLDKSLLLLDSSAARSSAIDNSEHSNQSKPILTHSILTSVLSNWTQIPASHLYMYKFKLPEFNQHMQQKIYGQDAAITIIGSELQHLQSLLEKPAKPFGCFIFAGPKHIGKHAVAAALAEQLYKQPNVLFISQPGTQNLNSITHLKVKRQIDKHYTLLRDVLYTTPHAILVIDQLDNLPLNVLDELTEICSTGYLNDSHGNEYDFRHCTLLMNTRYGTNRLIELTNKSNSDDDDYESGTDLMQLVMNEQRRKPYSSYEYTADDLVDAILPELTTLLPPALIQHVQIVPFIPLTKAAIEKIIHQKLKQLTQALATRHYIEFSYAPEIVNFLMHEILHQQELDQANSDIEFVFKQLHATIEQAISSQADNKNRPNQLFLQLNETGQLLRCDWIINSALQA